MIKRMIISAAVLVMFLGCSEQPQQKLIGSWIVDYAETFKAIKSSTVWEEMGETEKEMFPDLLDEMITDMQITISETELITSIGNEQINVPYQIISEQPKQVVLNTVINEEEIELTFKLISNKYIMFSSSATDDMDYLVWKRAAVHKV